jgi:tetratricopeptide (TPR) repeat protein
MEEELEDFADIKEERSCVFEERLASAEELRQAGNRYFAAGDLINAEDCYHRALFHVNFDPLQYNFELMDQHREGLDKVKHPVCLNLAAVRLKYGYNQSAVILCKAVLKEDANNTKALYRRAQAYKALKQIDLAKEDIIKAFKLAPGDTKVYELYREIKAICAREEAKVARFWKGRLVKEPKPFSLTSILSIRNPFNLFYWIL